MERREDDQWSWWQENPDGPLPDPVSSTTPLPTTEPWTSPEPVSTAAETSSPTPNQPTGSDDPVRKVLIGLVAVLALGLAGVSYQRWGTGTATPTASVATTAAAITEVADTTTTPTTALTTTTAPTTTAAPSTTTTTASTTTTSIAVLQPGPPGPPLEVTVVSTGRSTAEIRWRSDDCVGSRYRVGEFEPGGGGYPDVNRCWFNHVILAGDPAFSPPLEPNTTYTVRIEAIGEDGSASDPVEVQFTTSA